jgi:hypothetical protein
MDGCALAKSRYADSHEDLVVRSTVGASAPETLSKGNIRGLGPQYGDAGDAAEAGRQRPEWVRAVQHVTRMCRPGYIPRPVNAEALSSWKHLDDC